MNLLVYLIVFALVVGGYMAYRQVKAERGKKPTHRPVPDPPRKPDIPVRKATEKINVPDILPPPPLTPSRKDRLFVDGVEVDSHLNERGLVEKTKLPARTAKRGESYVTKLVVMAEPLENPADREKLRDWLNRPAPVDSLPGTHQLHVIAWPWTIPGILMSAPRVKLGTDTLVHEHTSNPSQRVFGLYFYGDKPMRVEIEIPWNITQGEIPEWAWTAFQFQWKPRRPNSHETEWAEQEVVIE